VALLALAPGLGLMSIGAAGARALPRCPVGEGNPIAIGRPTGAPATMRVQADLSERIDMALVTETGRRVRSYSTEKDVFRVSLRGLAAGTYRLQVKAAYTYPVPETGELGLCVRVNGRTVSVFSG
jgi:hypothetical protein